MSTSTTYRFSFGPWNISEGADPFGPETRATFAHEEKFALYRPLGFEGVQFHDEYDQDKNFGAANLRVAFNQVRVLEEAGYGSRGEFVGLDVKTMRTQSGCPVTAHLTASREIFLHLVDKVRALDSALISQFRDARDYEAMELYLVKHLMGLKP